MVEGVVIRSSQQHSTLTQSQAPRLELHKCIDLVYSVECLERQWAKGGNNRYPLGVFDIIHVRDNTKRRPSVTGLGKMHYLNASAEACTYTR
jgi:hypothetical protein